MKLMCKVFGHKWVKSDFSVRTRALFGLGDLVCGRCGLNSRSTDGRKSLFGGTEMRVPLQYKKEGE